MKTKGLRIATRYTSIDELVSKMSPFCEGDTLFVGTRDAQAVGIEAPFALQLADGAFALRGFCVVLEAWDTPDSPFHKPGLRLRLSQLTPESEPVLARLQAASRADAGVDAAAAAVAAATIGPRTPVEGERRNRRSTLQPAVGQLRKPAPVALAALAAHGRISPARGAGEGGVGPRLARGSGPDPGDNPLFDLSIVSLEDLIESRLAEADGAAVPAEAEAAADGVPLDDDGQTLAQPWRVLTPPKPVRAPTWATPPAVARTPAPVLLPAPPGTPSSQLPAEAPDSLSAPGAAAASGGAGAPASGVLDAVDAADAADARTEISSEPPADMAARGGTVLAPPAAVLPGRAPATVSARALTPAPVPSVSGATPVPSAGTVLGISPRAVTPRPPTPAPAPAPASAPASAQPARSRTTTGRTLRPPTPAPPVRSRTATGRTSRPPTPAPPVRGRTGTVRTPTSVSAQMQMPLGPVLPLLTSPRPPPRPRPAALRWGLAIAAAVLLIGGAVAAALAI